MLQKMKARYLFGGRIDVCFLLCNAMNGNANGPKLKQPETSIITDFAIRDRIIL